MSERQNEMKSGMMKRELAEATMAKEETTRSDTPPEREKRVTHPTLSPAELEYALARPS